MPIQGTAADIMKIAMIRVHRGCARCARCAMLLSGMTRCCSSAADEVAALAPEVRATMESALRLDVPLDVDLKVGDDWESMTPLPRD